MEENMSGRKNDIQVAGTVKSGGVRAWEMKSINFFLDLLNLKSLGIIQVRMTRKQVAILI